MIEKNPRNARAFYYRSVARENTQDHSGAIADILSLLDLEPIFNFPAKWNYPDCEEIHEFIRILTECNKAIDYHTLLLEPYHKRAELKEAAKDYAGAIADYTKIIKLKPGNSETYFKRGKNKDWHLKDYPGAIEDYNQALKIDPEFIEAYYCRGIAKHSIGDLKGAIDDYNQIIEMANQLDSEDLGELETFLDLTYFNRAILRKESGEFQSAVDDYTFAIQLNPYFSDAFSGRASVKFEMKDFSGAIKDSTHAIKMDKECAEVYHIRRKAKMELKKF